MEIFFLLTSEERVVQSQSKEAGKKMIHKCSRFKCGISKGFYCLKKALYSLFVIICHPVEASV